MQVNSVSDTNFRAKIIRTNAFKDAVMSAKNESNRGTKYSFYNAVNIIHDDSNMKSFEINKISLNEKSERFKYNILAKLSNGDVFTYKTSSFYDNEEADKFAVKAIIDFIGKFYSKKTASYIKLSRKFPESEINERIDGILIRNSKKYAEG